MLFASALSMKAPLRGDKYFKDFINNNVNYESKFYVLSEIMNVTSVGKSILICGYVKF